MEGWNKPTPKAKQSLPKWYWAVKMPDGQTLGGIENRQAASRKKNRLILEGGELVKWELWNDTKTIIPEGGDEN